jgi:hypothetical protein
MNVTLPNGRVIEGVPEGTTKQQIMQKAIAAGIATEADFDMPAQPLNTDVPSPEQDAFVAQGYAQNQPKPQPSIADRAIAGGEAALAMGTGATTGALGMIAGTLQQGGREILSGEFGTPDAANRIEQRAADVSASATYSPRTELGQEYVQNIGEVAAPLAGAAGLAAQTNIAANAARLGAPAVRSMGADAYQQAIARATPDSPQQKSMGAAEVPAEVRRREMAAQLPVDPQLTKGQATRDVNQLRFEGETMKGELGAPLRERASQQHQAIKMSIDEWLDQTGAQGADLRSVGISVDKAIQGRARADKQRIRDAYKAAEESGETREPIQTNSIVDVINNSRSAESTAPVLAAAKREVIRLGGAIEGEDGQLIPRDMTLGDAEQLRQFINKNTGYEGPNLAYSAQLKSAIDSTTENAGGDAYRAARRLREKYARQYEDRAIVADILETKRGSSDRKVALEDVFDRIVFRGSLDDARTMRKTLQTAGEEGQQAWREVQGAGLRYIRDEATKNISRDSSGNEMISPAALNRAIMRLDADGKLDFIYGKKGAEQLRALNEISKDLFTAPPGTINHSNTASVLLAALDIGISGTSGVPLPIASGLRIASKRLKDRKIKAKVEEALRAPKEGKK